MHGAMPMNKESTADRLLLTIEVFSCKGLENLI